MVPVDGVDVVGYKSKKFAPKQLDISLCDSPCDRPARDVVGGRVGVLEDAAVVEPDGKGGVGAGDADRENLGHLEQPHG